jgi:hypothetical protein
MKLASERLTLDPGESFVANFFNILFILRTDLKNTFINPAS